MNTQIPIKVRLLRIGFYVSALVVAGFVLYPDLQLPEPALTRGFTDKIYHVAGCMVLVLLASAAWHLSIWTLCLALPLSITLELIQVLAPGRGVHMMDMIANFGGVVFAIMLLSLGTRLFPKE